MNFPLKIEQFLKVIPSFYYYKYIILSFLFFIYLFIFILFWSGSFILCIVIMHYIFLNLFWCN